MKNIFKRTAALLLCFVLIAAMIPAYAVSASSEVDTAPKFRVLSAEEMTAEMGTGWNLGNTMDGHTGGTPNELQWQNTATSQEIIDAVRDYGFNTVRIPTTWGTMINEDNTIDERWINRVQDVVDYCVNNGMYAIINIHHDGADNGYWLDLTQEDMTPVYDKFAAVWTTIANHFKNYDEHLLFAAFNEIQISGQAVDVKAGMEKVNQLNQIFVDSVRATGGNNAQRWLVCPGLYTNIEATSNEANGYKLPTDTVKDRLFAEIHDYDWTFGLLETMGDVDFVEKNALALEARCELLDKAFISKGIPVIWGEYGAVNKNNPSERAYYNEAVNLICSKIGMIVPVYWDAGWYDRTKEPADFSFTLIDRDTLELVDAEVTHAIFRGFYSYKNKKIENIVKPATLVSAEAIKSNVEKLTLTAGENKKIAAEITNAQSNDYLVWTTSDPSVVTVLNGGYVTAVAPGSAVITVKAAQSDVYVDIPVTVTAIDADATLKIDNSDITLEEGAHTYVDVTLTSTSADDYVTYASSDKDVVTVSTTGKILAVGAGTAYVTVTTASGSVSVVKVVVNPAPKSDALPTIEIGINVYFNDSESNYFSNEYAAETVTVSENGQYTLTFDCAKDLSDPAKNAGVTGLNNLTAVYLKDHAITLGKDYKSHLVSCDIMWDSVIVDGKKLTVTQTAPKSAIKANGQFDTNDPLNSWDGSFVKEVEVANNVLNISAVDNPQKITITFTLSNLVFSDDAVVEEEAPVMAESVDISGDTAITATEIGEIKKISVMVNPADASDKVAFTSSDASVAAVKINGVAENGVINAEVTAVGYGECTIIATIANGHSAVFTFTCEEAEPEQVEPSATDTPADDKPEQSGGCAGGVAVIPAAAIIIAAALLIFKKRA